MCLLLEVCMRVDVRERRRGGVWAPTGTGTVPLWLAAAAMCRAASGEILPSGPYERWPLIVGVVAACKAARRLGSGITVASTVGAGSRFELWLAPANERAAVPATATATATAVSGASR
jgi:hypothetical protein